MRQKERVCGSIPLPIGGGSPEDFKHIFNYANASQEFLNQLQIRHPNEGIDAGFKRLADIHRKLEGFVKVVMEYYKK
jgi:hypothetical protein